MKEKMFFRLVLIAGAVTMLAACTSESENGPSANISYESIAATQQVPVTFGTYMGEQAITRSGTEGTISPYNVTSPSPATITANEVLATKGGFGVFAYYTNAPYNSSTKPDFMYDQAVTSTDAGANWLYSPIKYWPNDFAAGSAVDDQTTTAAQGTKASYLSFFAYAPYVATTDAANGTVGDTSYGITGFSHNNVNGDPLVSYKFDLTGKKSVDLLWGVRGASVIDPSVVGAQTGATTAGMPLTDLKKQGKDGKVLFTFKHALARLGLTVQAANDLEGAGGNALYDGSAANQTKIFVESVTINGFFPTTGTLNLNNTAAGAYTPNWTSKTASVSQSLTIDNTTGNINPDLDYNVGTLSTIFTSKPGVITASPTPLMVNATVDPNNPLYFMVIPNNIGLNPSDSSVNNLSFTIVYHVVTADANLQGGYSNITNTITKTVDAGFPMDGGKAYNFNLVLGVTSVKMTADVTPWDDSVGVTPVYLPINVD